MVRRKVDLPHPDGPMRAVTCLGSMVMVTSSSALNDPNHALTCSTSMRLAMEGPPSGNKSVSTCQEPGDHRQEKHDGDQRKRAGPGPIHGHVEGGTCLLEHIQRQGGLRSLQRVRA